MIAMLEGSATATIIFAPMRLMGRARCFWTISSGRRRTTSELMSYFDRSTTGRLNCRPRKARSSSSFMCPAFTRMVPIRSRVFSWVSRADRSWSALIRFPLSSISPIFVARTDTGDPTSAVFGLRWNVSYFQSFLRHIEERLTGYFPAGPEGEAARGLVGQHRQPVDRRHPPGAEPPDQRGAPCPVDYIGKACRFLYPFNREILPLPAEPEGGALHHQVRTAERLPERRGLEGTRGK